MVLVVFKYTQRRITKLKLPIRNIQCKMFDLEPDDHRLTRWYFGGIAACFATCLTHPLDLIKIAMETEQVMEKLPPFRYVQFIIQTEGISALYWGLFGAMRQNFITVSVRFGLYEKFESLEIHGANPHLWSVGSAAIAGVAGGFVKTPFELINTRMMFDLKLPPHERRNYQSLWKAFKFVSLMYGYKALFSGASLSIIRTTFMNVGQICFYKEAKQKIMETDTTYKDTFRTHALASLGVLTTIICQPSEVLRTRYITSGENFQGGIWRVFLKQISLGIFGFYRGSFLTFIKIGPNTVITFVLMEQMRLYFGEQVIINDEDTK